MVSSSPRSRSPERLTDPLSARPPPRRCGTHLVGVLPGEGIGPEVVGAALDVLAAVESATAHRFELRTGGAIGLPALRECGRALSPEVEEFCEAVFRDGGAILCGAGGGRFVYELRERFDLFVKVVPLRPIAALRDTGVLRPEVTDGVDVLLVRENAGGEYLGRAERTERDGEIVAARHAFGYDADRLDRLLRYAFRLAEVRQRRVAVVTKPGGLPSISELWRARAERLADGFDVEYLDIDNACYQLVADPRRFDVVVTTNLFGDVLGDGATVLLRSRGCSFSINLTEDGHGVYQTGHGGAYDLAGSDRANPVGQILSLAELLRTSFGLADAADAVEHAVEHVLAAGLRTRDVAARTSTVVGTREMTRRIAAAVAARLRSEAGDASADAAA